MVSSLKNRIRPDTQQNQTRTTEKNIGRNVYLVMLALFSLAIGNYLWGDIIVLRSDGLVIKDKAVIATSYVARVEQVDVEQGQKVSEGAQLLRLESTEVLERIADLSIQKAALAQRSTEFHLRSASAKDLLPFASKREASSKKALARLDGAANKGLLTSARYEDALRESFDAREDKIRLTAESQTLHTQLSSLEAALSDAAIALDDLRAHYADGFVRAPVSGSIGADIPSPGTVYRPGETIVTVFSGDAYVLTYLPRRYFFSLHPGMKVSVSSGREKAEGVIAEILPLSVALPDEFQNTFKPQDRNQLAKIKLSTLSDFPIYEKVTVTRRYF